MYVLVFLSLTLFCAPKAAVGICKCAATPNVDFPDCVSVWNSSNRRRRLAGCSKVCVCGAGGMGGVIVHVHVRPLRLRKVLREIAPPCSTWRKLLARHVWRALRADQLISGLATGPISLASRAEFSRRVTRLSRRAADWSRGSVSHTALEIVLCSRKVLWWPRRGQSGCVVGFDDGSFQCF